MNALTMRIPCAVSCSDFIICMAPWNSLAMILRTRMPIFRTPTAASGTNISANMESSGSCETITTTRPTIVSTSRESVGDQEVESAACRLGDERLPGDEFGRMGLAVVANLHPEHLVEDALLDVRHDRVCDSRQHHLLAIGRKALDGVDRDNRGRDFPDGRQLLGHEDLVDDPTDDPSGRRRRGRNQAHHREREDVPLPVLRALVQKQPAKSGVRGRIKK